MKTRRRGGHTKLTEAQKAFLVQRFAGFDSPKEAVAALLAEHGVKFLPTSAERYDPTKVSGRRLSEQWRRLFAEARKRCLEQLEHIPEAHRAVRMGKLAKAANVLEAESDYRGMADMLERIAKEVGGVYTNRRELTGHGGGPLQLEVRQMSDEQLDARIAQLTRRAGPHLVEVK